MLRRAVIGLGALYLVAATVLLLAFHAGIWVAVYLALNGAAIAGAVLFERGRYRPRIDAGKGVWQTTGERFIDPTNGQLMEVHYNPATGQRNYVPVDDPPPALPPAASQ